MKSKVYKEKHTKHCMTNDIKTNDTSREEILKKKASLFFEQKLIAHVKLFNGRFLNGRFFEVGESSAIIHDRVNGAEKIFFLEVKSISEFEVRE